MDEHKSIVELVEDIKAQTDELVRLCKEFHDGPFAFPLAALRTEQESKA